MSKNLITYEVIQKIAHIGLNDPERLNVLSIPLVKELNTAITKAENDQNIKAILLFGHGRGFCAGGDLKEFYALTQKPQHDPISDWEYLYDCKLPVILAAHGYVVGGGCELLMMCDYAIASEKTIFSQPELTLGFIPGCGATQRLPKKIGYGNAFDMMVTGKKITAHNAYTMGLIEEITEENQLLNIAHNKALLWTKRERQELINLKQSMRKDSAHEREMFYQMICANPAKTHIQKFLEKSS
jgi:enoyl-CoA hydratase